VEKIIKLNFKKGSMVRYKNCFISALFTFLNISLVKTVNTSYIIETSVRLNLWNIFENLFDKDYFMFSYSINKIDKSKRKNLKNKADKYIILWKYVPLYKRYKNILKILVKEIKFFSLLKLKNKIEFFVSNLMLNKGYFFNKYTNFINKYVFKNLKTKLLSNYKTFK